MRSSSADKAFADPITLGGRRPKNEPAPLSIIATRIVQEAVGADVSVADLAKLAMGDPGFAARVVSMVNSAGYGLKSKVADVRQACALIGVRGLRNMALALVVGDMVPPGEDGGVLLTTSLRRAVAARLVAGALGDTALDDAFTSGLLLEIGLLSRARGDLAGAAQVARMPAAHRPVVERAFGFDDHAVAGAALGESMHLPPATIEAVRHHHDVIPPASRAAKIAWAAERVAGAWEGGDVRRIGEDARQALLAVGVPANAIDELLHRVPELVKEAAATFQRPIDAQVDLAELAVDANARLVELNEGYEHLVRRLEQLLAEKDALAGELSRANSDLANLAATDALTGLPNKRAFDEALVRDLSRADRAGANIGLVMIDVDHFKKVNDTWGHPIGDRVLATVGDVLRGALRTGDVPARYGGEEFVALLPAADAEGARIVAERIRGALERAVVAGSTGPLAVTASFGVAVVRGPGCRDAGESLLRRADAALYEAKRTGRNRVVVAK